MFMVLPMSRIAIQMRGLQDGGWSRPGEGTGASMGVQQVATELRLAKPDSNRCPCVPTIQSFLCRLKK